VDGVRLIVGLGNPGSRYERTRHNAGFLVVERILAAGGGRWSRAGEGGVAREEAAIRLGSRELLLARPLMYMNRSGEPVWDLLQVHGLAPASMLVVVDDAALPPGRLRLRVGGGSGGHNGLRSIQDVTGTNDYPRLRIGIGTPAPGIDLADFVLEQLSGEAWTGLMAVVAAAAEAVEVTVLRGLTAAMDVFNRDPAPGAEAGAGPADRGNLADLADQADGPVPADPRPAPES
jgi:PTH1 family peptidyl-tRNA hydrolase